MEHGSPLVIFMKQFCMLLCFGM